MVQREMRNFEDAIAAQKKAIFLKPDNLWACIELGECLRLKGRLIKALDIMDSVLMKDANHPRALRRKGVILRALGNYEQAKICLLKAIEHEPNNAWSYSELGETYRVMGNYEEALEMLRLALNIEKENPNSWTLARMGAIYWHMNKAEKALSFLEESIKKDSSYVFAL